ncbi:1-acyl-sn-glycerol-3-phosphate acyltransferase [Lichenihabitans sp. PAMC28606]|uniref:lysophospholipid acyltransferase family protein n=1 Tax=Lichenihabitans sp. PAMC28606 TaxID=2880932 RepID=UPI001D0B2922|nr:lysophospholipid acyltransferase family protein [Lichenihabitans sp. PAMC28606]UDL93357.1 1-acyl-sn-glycerol-3-phosphate acyltransferase [Lichenihabitans sp. PAMC28606]
MLILRSLVFNVAFYIALVLIMLVLLPTILFGPDKVKAAARIWGHASLWLLRVICGTKVEFRGLEHIPEGGCIIAPKHQSVWEVFALITVFKDFTYVLKRELTWLPLFGWYIACGRQIAIDRSKGRAALSQVARKARDIIGENRQLFIFPEGTRKAPGAPPDYKFGAAYVYNDLKVPCLPVALDSGLFWPRRSFLRRPGTIVVEILPVIEPGLSVSAFLRTLEDRIETATNRLMAEAIEKDPRLAEGLYRAPVPAVDPA